MKRIRNLFLFLCLVVMALTAVASPAFAWTINASAGANGAISPTGAVTVAPGDNQTFTITPDAGYLIASLTVDGGAVPAAVGALTYDYPFVAVIADHDISATFVLAWTITSSVTGLHGTISPLGATLVVPGANQTFTITPSAGYHVSLLMVDGVAADTVSLVPRTFTNVTANHTIAVTFAINTYTITANLVVPEGTVTPLGVTTVTYGGSQTYTITPIACYEVVDVLVNGVSVGAVTSYPFTNVQANKTISATFALRTFTITSSAGANGVISPPLPAGAGGPVGPINCGDSQTFTVKPLATFVARVLINGIEDTSMATGNSAVGKNYIFTHVSADYTIDATFAQGTPVISPVIGPRTITAQTVLSFQVSATDPAGHDVTWSLDLPSIALGMTIGQGAGVDRMKGNFSWTPTRDQIGNHTVRFTVQDAGGNFAFEDVVISVTCSMASIVPPTTPRTLVAGYPNTFLVTGMSADTADVEFVVGGDTTTGYRLPTGVALTNQSNPGVDRMKVQFAWTPTLVPSQLGTYTVRFTAADSCAWGWPRVTPDLASDRIAFSSPVTLNVILGNPVVTLPSGSATYSTSTRATDTLTASKFGLRLYATSPITGHDVVWSIDPDPAYQGPAWATLFDSSATPNSWGAFYHLVGAPPTCADAGIDTVRFIATDPLGVDGVTPLSDTIKVAITVLPGNPVAGVIGSHDTLDVMTTTVLNYTLSATDPNTPDSVTWSVPTADTLGTNLVLTNNANWSGHFAWTPGPLQAGVHQFHFIATDNWGCADTELVTIVVSSTRMLAVAFDTIPKTKADVPLLKFKIGLDGYTLTSLKIRSKIQKEYAISKLSLWKNNAGTPFATTTITGRFDDNIEKTFTGLSILLDSDDTITVKVDTWPERIDADTAYQMTGLELVIPPNGMVFQKPLLPDAILFPYFICNTLAVDSLTGEWKGTPNYRVRFDLYGPQFTVDVTDMNACTETNYIHVGSKLAFHVHGLNEKVPDSTITVNLSAFGIANPYTLKRDNPLTGSLRHFYNPNWNLSTAYLTQEWYDTVTVGDDNLDFDTGYKITFVAKDKYLNEGKNDFVFSRRIDTIKPKVDSLRLFLSQNNVGDTSATIGDELTLIAYLGSSGYFEVKSVSADLQRFGEVVPLALEDLTNGNNVWRGKFILKNDIGVDIPWGADSLRKSAIITAVDSACNVTIDTAYLRNALDLFKPFANSKLYMTKADFDTSNATNIGDSVYVRIDLKDNLDIDSVWADFKQAGLGGLAIQPLYDDGTHNDSASADGIWSLGWRIGKQTDPTLDPDPVDAKDVNSQPYNSTYTVKVYVQDDAGVIDTIETSVLTRPQGGVALLDTRRPTEINHNFVQIKQLAAGKIRLIWPRKLYAQAEDARQFYVYVDSAGGSGFNFDKSHIFGTTYDGEYTAPGDTLNAWTSEVLTSNKTYRFVVRTRDDGGNFELNTTPYVAIPDGEAPFACVVYPAETDTGKYWGVENPLIVTATTTSTDLDAAWVMYRNTNIGGGIPGQWTRLAPNMSIAPGGLVLRDTIALPQLAQFKGHYEFYIIAQDKAGNVLSLESAQSGLGHCPAFTFFWEPQTIQPDFLAINGAMSPQSSCGFNVSRDNLNTAEVTVIDGDTTAAIYTIDSWVLIEAAGIRDSVRIEYKDLQKIPFTYSFSVNDWPKTGSAVTDLWVRITNTRNGAAGIASVHLCVPDVKAPDIRITYPTAYQRVPLAKTSLNRVPVRAKIVSTSYDPTLPIRMEFFYQVDGTTDWVKIGETGSEGANGFEVAWDNSKLSEGWVWLKAKVTDNANNTMETPLIKIFLDKTVPLMTLTIPDAIMVNGGLVVKDPGPDYFINLNAEITNTTIDIAKVEFFISYRDSVDLVKYYHLIGEGYAALNNSIWRYKWYINEWTSGEGEHGGWMKCGFDYKLRIKITDIAGNVYDDEDGDGQFDDYTFWANPFTSPISLNTPADDSKKLFRLDCGAPQVAISEVTAGDRTYQTPSSKLHGPAIVYMKKGETVGAQSIVLDSLNDLGGVKQVEYFFKSPVNSDAWMSVGYATTSPWTVSFDPFAKGLITDNDIFHNEYQSGIKAVLTDSLNQKTEDQITLIVLDTIPGIAAWKTPSDAYVWGTVGLSIWSLEGDYHAYGTYRYVTYKYKPANGGDWVEIATVRRTEGGDTTFYLGQWPTLNQVADGSYILGFETQDQNLNVKGVDNNPKNNVIVHNAVPTVTITSPATGGFFGCSKKFKADANSPIGVRSVVFEYKPVTTDINGPWTAIGTDNAAPWETPWSVPAELAEGFYDFRAVVTNMAGRSAFSPNITLFHDKTDPRAYFKTISDGTTTWDMEAQESGRVSVDEGTKMLSIVGCAFDDASPLGSQLIYNSGMGAITLEYVGASDPSGTAPRMVIDSMLVDTGGCHTFYWDISHVPVGDYTIYFTAYDKVSCNYTDLSFVLNVGDVTPPLSYIAGFYQDSLYGLVETEFSLGQQSSRALTGSDTTWLTSVQFQWSANDGTTWIPIDISKKPVALKSLSGYNGKPTLYGLYVVGWIPVNNTYKVRMIAVDAAGNPSIDVSAPPVTMQIVSGVATVTSNAADFGPASIEKSLESQPQDGVEGIGRISTNPSYGMPFGVAIGHNLLNYAWSYEIIDLRKTSQQSDPQKFAGPFNLSSLVVGGGGYGWGQVFFFGASADLATGFSQNGHLDGWWITRALGSGGPVHNEDHSVTVTVPQSWSPSTDGSENLLVISQSELPAAAVSEDRLFRPVGNDNGMAYFIGNLGAWSWTDANEHVHYSNWCSSDDDNRFVTIKMKYNSQINLPAESLKVLRYDENIGAWLDAGINFPHQSVGGFNTTEHTVEFATQCLSGPFSVAVPVPPNGYSDITLWSLEPSASVNSQIYTQGYPKFRYQVPQIFRNVIDWSMLEIKVDGHPIWTGTGLTGGGTWAEGWYVNIDRVSGQVHFWMKPFTHDDENGHSIVDDMLPPLTCGEHTIYVGVLDNQSNLHYTGATASKIMVDCKPPHVTFPNSYVSKNPTIEFQIADDVVGVDWDSVFVDVYFVEKSDTAAGGAGNDNLQLQTTFSPDQIKDYRVGTNGVKITTTYELHDERAVLVVVYDGWRHGVPTNYPFNFYGYYFNWEGVLDLVGNHVQPSEQFLSVDYEAPKISLTSTSGNCPMVFRINDDGSGFTEDSIMIRENGIVLTSGKQSSVSAVNGDGKWYFLPSAEGGLLYYCPTLGAKAEILVADRVGNRGSSIIEGPGKPPVEGDLTVTMSDNPFDPATQSLTLDVSLRGGQGANVTCKIYDMGGDLVATLNPAIRGTLTWNGETDGGSTIVANGVYLAHIVAEASGGSVSTVVKIAVVKK